MSASDRPDARIEAEAQQWLVRLRRDGPSCRDEFEDWYVASPRHADHYDQVLATWEASGLLADSSRQKRRRWRAWFAAVAAMLVIFACLGIVTFAGIGHSRAETISLTTAVGEIRTERLPDGTRVTLDTDSRVDAVFTALRREIRLLRGRARVAVARDAKRPIDFETDAATLSSGQLVDVARDRGQTTFAMLGGAGTVRAGKNSVPLSAGQEVAISDRAISALAGPRALPRGAARWPSGMLSFEDTPLAEVVAAANRYSGMHIVLVGNAIGQLRFTGTFKAGDMTALARLLSQAFHLTVSRRSDGALMLAPAPTK